MIPASIRRASTGATGRIAELLAGREHRVPQVVAAAGVEQVDLEALDRGPAGPADQHRDVLDVEPVAPVVLEVETAAPTSFSSVLAAFAPWTCIG